jgi:hypothetical protein
MVGSAFDRMKDLMSLSEVIFVPGDISRGTSAAQDGIVSSLRQALNISMTMLISTGCVSESKSWMELAKWSCALFERVIRDDTAIDGDPVRQTLMKRRFD